MVIVGGGIAAYAAAIRAARLGLVVTVLSPGRRQLPEYVETLSPGGVKLLRNLGFSRSALCDHFPEVIEHRSRWGNSKETIKARVPGLQGPVMLGKSTLTGMLRDLAVGSGVQVLAVDRIINAAEIDTGIRVSFSRDGEALDMEFDFAVDASGRPSLLARLLGVKRTTLDHLVAYMVHGPAKPQFVGVVATVTIADGWTFWASCPSGSGSFGFFTTSRKLGEKMDAPGILSRMPAEVAKMMAEPEEWLTNGLHAFNCSSSSLLQPGGVHWLAAGDALQTFDPLASTGVATALRQADAAAVAIASGIGGDRSLLQTYHEQARSDFIQYVTQRNLYYGH